MITIIFVISLISITASAVLQSSFIKLNSLLKRLLGTLIFGIAFIPLILTTENQTLALGLSFHYNTSIALISLILAAIISIMNMFTAKTSNNINVYPQIRIPLWDLAITIKSALAWTVYLTVYEAVFRGIFLYAGKDLFGFWFGVILNILVYSLAHLLKNKREAILSIPFGGLMIYLTWASGSCWYAAFVHVILALSHEWASIKANPDMKFSFSLTKNLKQ